MLKMRLSCLHKSEGVKSIDMIHESRQERCSSLRWRNIKLYTLTYVISALFMISGLIFCLRSVSMRSTAPLALGLPSFFFGTAIYLLIQIATK